MPRYLPTEVSTTKKGHEKAPNTAPIILDSQVCVNLGSLGAQVGNNPQDLPVTEYTATPRLFRGACALEPRLLLGSWRL